MLLMSAIFSNRDKVKYNSFILSLKIESFVVVIVFLNLVYN